MAALRSIEFKKNDVEVVDKKKTVIVLFVSTLAFSLSFSINSLIEIFIKNKSERSKYLIFIFYIILIVCTIIFMSSFFNFQLS